MPSKLVFTNQIRGLLANLPASVGVMPVSLLGTGTPTSSNFLRGDGAWATVAGGITSLNGLTTATQTFQTGTTGTDVAFSSAAGVHTLDIPTASTTARGLVSTAAQTFAGRKTFSELYVTGSTDTILLDITPTAGQTANQQVWRNSGGSAIGLIDNSGRPVFGQGSWTVTASFHALSWSGGAIGWASGTVNGSSTLETGFARDGAGLVGLRVGTTAHDLRIYNTYTSSSVYERGSVGFVGNIYTIGSYALGAGTTLRGINLGVSGNSIGLYGATPVARATTSVGSAAFVANTGTMVSSSSTFGGYTLQQIAQALISLGVLT